MDSDYAAVEKAWEADWHAGQRDVGWLRESKRATCTATVQPMALEEGTGKSEFGMRGQQSE
jgi:hypothetical protein